MFDQETLKRKILLRRIIQGLIVLAIFVMAVTPIKQENDIYWQMRMGEDIVRHHYFPVRDPYSLPAYGEIWTLHEWLPSVSFYIVNSHFGSAGLVIYKALIIAVTFGIFMLLFNRLKANLYLSILVFALAALVNTRGIWMVFPSIFEYLFLVLILFLLESFREKPRKIIPIFLAVFSFLWANSHGSFFLLPGIVGVYVLGDILVAKLIKVWHWYKPLGLRLGRNERAWLILVIIVSLVAPLFTPNGYETYLYPFRISLGKFTGYVSEYQHFWTVWRGDWSDFVHGFALILMAVLVLIFITNIKRLHPTDLVLGMSFSVLAWSAVRHVAIFALVALFLIVRYLGAWFGEYRGVLKRTLLKDILLIFLTVFVTFYYKSQIAPLGWQWLETDFPKEAAELIMNNKVPGNMFNHYNYGGYLIWKMPEYKVFIDGRLEMYQGEAGEDYMTILMARRGYQELLGKYQINFFILYLTDPIIESLVSDPEWKYVYHDEQYVVFVRDTPENERFLSQYWSEEKQEEFREAYRVALGQYRTEWLNRRGAADAAKNNLPAALMAFEEAVRYNPRSTSARLNLAQVLLSLGMYEEAKQEYEYILSSLDAHNESAQKGKERVEKLLKLVSEP